MFVVFASHEDKDRFPDLFFIGLLYQIKSLRPDAHSEPLTRSGTVAGNCYWYGDPGTRFAANFR